MSPVYTVETSVRMHSTLRNIPENGRIQVNFSGSPLFRKHEAVSAYEATALTTPNQTDIANAIYEQSKLLSVIQSGNHIVILLPSVNNFAFEC